MRDTENAIPQCHCFVWTQLDLADLGGNSSIGFG